MAAQQVVLLASPTQDSMISAWDLHTGTQLSSYKGNSAARNGLCRAGLDYLAASQTNKDALQFWTWHKDQPVQRGFAMERLTAVAASPDGALLAAGGSSGAVYIWESGSGRLLRSWAAHYKAVTVLAFTTSAAILVTGAEDTLVHAWMMCDLLDASLDSNAPAFARPAPLHTWSDHSLPVTGLAVGSAGCEAACLVVSSSLDRSIKIHRMSDGALLAAVTLPVAAVCVTMDAGEHALYVGGADGTIYEVSLVGEVPEVQGSNKAGSTSSTAALQGSTSKNTAAADAVAGSSGLGGLGAGAASASLVPHAKMQGHARAVNALAVSIDGELLVSGSDDGTAQVWDLRSRQPLHTINSPSKLPVTCVLVLPRPLHLSPSGAGSTGTTAGASIGSTLATTGNAAAAAASVAMGGRHGPKRLAPLAPLLKYPGMRGNLRPWESAPVILDGSHLLQGGVTTAALRGGPLLGGLMSGLAGGLEEGLGPSLGADQLSAAAGLQLLQSIPGTAGLTGAQLQGQLQGGQAGAQQQQHQQDGGHAGASSEVNALRAELLRVKQELAAANASAAEWRALHAELHSFCIDQVMAPS